MYILAEVTIEDSNKFLEIFSTEGFKARRNFGCRESQVFKADENRIFILFDWESREMFENFRQDETVKETMKSSGMTSPPKFTFVDKILNLKG